MKCLIRERLSEHKYKTPEGYLICVDSILARTGKQAYRRSELFQDGDDSEVDVDRPEDEVFSPATLASFENKPIVVEHPDEDVNANNIKQYAVGFVRDVKRGKTTDGQDVMLGTLVIQDAQTIEEIENGEHTDLSCGYDCDIADDANPTQRNIRGNHVALCAQGRAGIAKIVDSVKAFDFDAQLQENKLSKTSIEYRKKMSEQPNNKKTLLLEAENIIRQIVDDTNEKDKATIRRYADKHLSDIRAFAASLKDSVNDSAQEDWFRLLSRNNIAYGFVKGGYGMRFRSVSAYNKAKDLAKQVGYTAGHWYDDTLEHFEYSSTVIKNEDSIKEKDSMIKDAKYAIWVKEHGQWKPWGSTDREIGVAKLKEQFRYYEDARLMPNDGSKPRDSVEDGYNKFANEKDTKYLKEALDEMRRYERNWSGMSAREKQNIATGGISELRENIRNAEARLRQLNDSVNDSMIGDARVMMSGEHNDVGNDFYGYFVVDHPNYGSFYVSFKTKRRGQEVQLDGTGWNFIKSKGYTPEQKQWIIKHKSELDNLKGGYGVIADSVEADDIVAKDSVSDGSPVDVLNVVQSKRDNTGKTWYLLEIRMKSGTRAYIVTADYKGEKTYTGGGAVSFNLNTAKSDLDAFITINELNIKYGRVEGYKRYMAGQKDSDTFAEVTNSLKKNEPNVDNIIDVVKAVKAVKSMKDMPALTPAQNVPAHIVFRNRVKPEDLVQSLRKSTIDKSFEQVAIGNIAEIIADFKADISNPKLDRTKVIAHYREYRRNAEHWSDKVSQNVRRKLDELMRSTFA